LELSAPPLGKGNVAPARGGGLLWGEIWGNAPLSASNLDAASRRDFGPCFGELVTTLDAARGSMLAPIYTVIRINSACAIQEEAMAI
jgi:hypothetical protein